jgi:predicted GH43/DUF377 family glycosyl hydrolase
VLLQRYEGNPILAPHADHLWEDLAVFNPGAWYDEARDEVILLYRAAESHPEYKCYFGLATSTDGQRFQRVSDQPVLSPSRDGFDGSTIQDPRVVKIGDWYYVTYAARHFPFGQYWAPEAERYRWPESPVDFPGYLRRNATLSGLLLTRDFRQWIRAGVLTDPRLDDRDVVLFPERVRNRYVMLHRPLEWCGPEYGCTHPSIWISLSDDLFGFRQSKLLVRRAFDWEANKIGANTPPIKTRHGWLTIYHAVGEDHFYRLGALLLDLDDPTIVRYRTRHWIMQPEADYEIEGYYRGCVFPCGKFARHGMLYVYYGAADKYCCLATCKLQELIDYLLTCPVES